MIMAAENETSKVTKIAEVQAKVMTTQKPVNIIVRGIKLKVYQEALDDLDVLDDLRRLQEEDVLVLPRLIVKVVGDEWPRVKKLLSVDGRVSASDGATFFMEVCEAIGAKNS
jgi:hypothetical protein